MDSNLDELKAQTQFFHLFKAMYDSGDVAAMGSHAFNVYCYIKSCVNYERPDAFPSIETICKATGVSRANVFRCIPVLVDMGYLTKNTSGRHTIYRVCERIPMLDENGDVQATASWEYIPKYAVKAVSELKELIQSSGDANAARYIHIEHLQVIVSNIESGGVQNIVAGDNVDNSTTNAIHVTRESQTLEDHLNDLAQQGDGNAAAKLKRSIKKKTST